MAGRTTLVSPVCRRDVQHIDLRVSIAAVLFSWIGKYPVRIPGKLELDGGVGPAWRRSKIQLRSPNSAQKVQMSRN